MFCALLLSIDDVSLGRIDHASLSQQSLMELLIADISAYSKERFESICGEYLNVCDWDGVECTDNGEVVSVHWVYFGMKGPMNMIYIPLSMRRFDVRSQELIGIVDFTILPASIVTLCLSVNIFSGTVDLTQLPDSLETLNLSYNNFSGSVNLLHLPGSLHDLHLHKNTFEGSLNLTKLPKSLYMLNLNNNKFGPVVGAKIPRAWISLGGNGLLEVVDENGDPILHDKIML